MNHPRLVPLSILAPGTRGRIARITRDLTGRAERLAALGVTPGASVRLLQRFPGIVFECDQTEMAVERGVAAGIVIEVDTERGGTMSHPPTLTLRPRPRAQGLRRLVSNTPLLAIDYSWNGRERTVYAKCEHLNLTGSIKDRMALHILERAHLEGRIAPGDTIAEATSGNTGISFAALGRAFGHPVTIFMPDWMSRERVQLIASFGARIVPVSREEGGFLGAMQRAQELADRDPHVFLPSQFSNEANPSAHECSTGPEIFDQLTQHKLPVDAFVAGVGTGGTVMGVGRYLRRHWPNAKVHPLEPAESPTLSVGHKVGHHRIQGISDEFVPPVLDLSELNEIVSVHDGDAIVMAQKLARDLGLGVGISSGANFVGAIQLQNQMGDDAVVVTVFPDSNKKYLSTDLLGDEPLRPNYLAPHAHFTGYTALGRVCSACFDGPTPW